MTASNLHGVVPMLVTPLQSDDQIDEHSLRRLVAHQIESGAHGIGILGLAGEGVYLSIAERERVTDIVLEAAGTLPVLVGCTADSTDEASRLAAGAASRGAAEVMVAPPRRADWTRDQFKDHYRAVAAAAGPDCAVMVQDAPFAIGIELGVELVLELAAEMANVRSFKIEALPFFENAVRSTAEAGAGLHLFGGHGGLYLMDVLDSGAHGLIPGSDATAPLASAWRAFHAGDRETADHEYRNLLPFLVHEAQSLALLVGGAKELLFRRGVIESTRSRLPGAELSDITRTRLVELATRAGLARASD